MPTYNENFANDIRDAFKAMLEADTYYDGITIIAEKHRDIQQQLAASIGIAGGIAVVLLIPQLGGTLPNLKGANFDRIRLVARVHENMSFSTTTKEAMDVAIHTAIVGNLYVPDAATANFRLEDPAVVRVEHPQFLTYDVSFLTAGGAYVQVNRLAALTVDIGTPSAVTISSATAGAAIYYTLDGTVPNPVNGTLYTGAVNAEGFTLRARGWLAGYLPSPEYKATL